MAKLKIIKNKKFDADFTIIPNKAFKLKATEFKLYCWLLKHEDNFQFGKMFMCRGTLLRNVAIEKSLILLVKFLDLLVYLNYICIYNKGDKIMKNKEIYFEFTTEEEMEVAVADKRIELIDKYQSGTTFQLKFGRYLQENGY